MFLKVKAYFIRWIYIHMKQIYYNLWMKKKRKLKINFYLYICAFCSVLYYLFFVKSFMWMGWKNKSDLIEIYRKMMCWWDFSCQRIKKLLPDWSECQHLPVALSIVFSAKRILTPKAKVFRKWSEMYIRFSQPTCIQQLFLLSLLAEKNTQRLNDYAVCTSIEHSFVQST